MTDSRPAAAAATPARGQGYSTTMTDEPLHPDLVPYLRDSSTLGRGIYHPLVQMPILPSHAMVNQMYQAKQRIIADAVKEERWHTVVFSHERPYRLEALIDYVVGRDDDGTPRRLADTSQEVIDLAVSVWTDSENIEHCVEDWRALFRDLDFFGTEQDRQAFEELPDPVTLWRGDIDDGGWSWSTSRKTAEFFATRWAEEGVEPARLISAEVPKSRIFGYLTGRNEYEALVRTDDPDDHDNNGDDG